MWGWHSPTHATEQKNSFNTLDLSATYRVNQYLGFSLGTRNLGSLHSLVPTQNYAGVGLRLFSGRIALGVDVEKQDAYSYTANGILRPGDGVELRASDDSNNMWSAGLFLQSGFGEVGKLLF